MCGKFDISIRSLTVAHPQGDCINMADESEKEVIELSAEDIVEAFQMPLTVEKRKAVKPVPPKYKGRTVIRVGSWNMLSFTKQKAANPGVREVMCQTILENR